MHILFTQMHNSLEESAPLPSLQFDPPCTPIVPRNSIISSTKLPQLLSKLKTSCWLEKLLQTKKEKVNNGSSISVIVFFILIFILTLTTLHISTNCLYIRIDTENMSISLTVILIYCLEVQFSKWWKKNSQEKWNKLQISVNNLSK